MPNIKVNYYHRDIDCIFKLTEGILSLSPVKNAVKGYHGEEITKNLFEDDYKIRMTKIIFDTKTGKSEVSYELENLDYSRHNINGDYFFGCLSDVQRNMIFPLIRDYDKPKEININYPIIKKEYYLWYDGGIQTLKPTGRLLLYLFSSEINCFLECEYGKVLRFDYRTTKLRNKDVYTDLSCFDVEFWKAKYKELKKEYKKEVAELEKEIERLRDYW